jgi:hypothetical protein
MWAQRTRLVSHLDYPISRPLIRRAHRFGLIDRERHGLFLIHVFPRAHGGDEALGVQMLRGGDHHRIERRIVEHLPVIHVCLCGRRELHGIRKAAVVNVGERGEFDARARDGFTGELRAAVANADDADTQPVARAQNLSSGETAGETRGHVADKVSSGLHGIQYKSIVFVARTLSLPCPRSRGHLSSSSILDVK